MKSTQRKSNPLIWCDKQDCRAFILSTDKDGAPLGIGRCSALNDTVDFHVVCPFYKTSETYEQERKELALRGHRMTYEEEKITRATDIDKL